MAHLPLPFSHSPVETVSLPHNPPPPPVVVCVCVCVGECLPPSLPRCCVDQACWSWTGCFRLLCIHICVCVCVSRVPLPRCSPACWSQQLDVPALLGRTTPSPRRERKARKCDIPWHCLGMAHLPYLSFTPRWRRRRCPPSPAALPLCLCVVVYMCACIPPSPPLSPPLPLPFPPSPFFNPHSPFPTLPFSFASLLPFPPSPPFPTLPLFPVSWSCVLQL